MCRYLFVITLLFVSINISFASEFGIKSFPPNLKEYSATTTIEKDGFIYNKKNGEKISGVLVKFREFGGVYKKAEYQKGQPNGLQQYFHKNGAVSVQFFYKDGKKHGTETQYYESGSVRSSTQYDSSGLPDGAVKDFYDSGELLSEAILKNGVLLSAKEYYKSGQIKKIAQIRNGQFDGQLKSYYESGKLLATVTYIKGKREGLACFFNEGGKIIYELQYIHNKLVSGFKDKKGKMVEISKDELRSIILLLDFGIIK